MNDCKISCILSALFHSAKGLQRSPDIDEREPHAKNFNLQCVNDWDYVVFPFKDGAIHRLLLLRAPMLKAYV